VQFDNLLYAIFAGQESAVSSLPG
ncbi:uncharacterized protein METZ01_LOCUS196536, partial [marine metagenome]